MSKLLYPDFFNDVFAPVMQPGSSGSFAGTCRIGQTARHCLKSKPKRVRILFQPSSHFFQKLGNMMIMAMKSRIESTISKILIGLLYLMREPKSLQRKLQNS